MVKGAGHGLNGSGLDPKLEDVDAKVQAFLARHLRPTPLATETPAPADPAPPSEGGDDGMGG